MSLLAKSPQNTRLIVSLCFPLLEALNDSCRSARCDFTSFRVFITFQLDQQNIFQDKLEMHIPAVSEKCVSVHKVGSSHFGGTLRISTVRVHPFLITLRSQLVV